MKFNTQGLVDEWKCSENAEFKGNLRTGQNVDVASAESKVNVDQLFAVIIDNLRPIMRNSVLEKS